MKITKTTTKYAERRNIELSIDEETVSFYELGDDCEPMFTYLLSDNDDGMLFKSNVWLPKNIKEELPAWIKNEKELKNVIDFVCEELKKY